MYVGRLPWPVRRQAGEPPITVLFDRKVRLTIGLSAAAV
jgi:hypothetical protein